MNGFVQTYRRRTYPKIDPTLPEHNQSGRTILITGASDGLGYAFAEGFASARASRIILVSRTQTKTDAAAARLHAAHHSTEFIARQCDCSSIEQIEQLWTSLAKEGIYVDVLVLNAGAIGSATTAAEVAAFFHFSVTCKLYLLEGFQKQAIPQSGEQEGAEQKKKQKIAIEITSASSHCYGGYPRPAYASARAGFANYLCHLADLTKEEELRIVVLHPGAVYTAPSHGGPVPGDSVFWDDISLPSHTAVWLTSKEAAFLHGRFIWANWDADELLGMRDRIEGDFSFLKVGITGVPAFGIPDLVKATQSG